MSRPSHVCGWAQQDGVWTCAQDHFAAGDAPETVCGRTWDPETGLSEPRKLPESAGPTSCRTCARAAVGTFSDGSARFDHGHLPDGTTWEATPHLESPESAVAFLVAHEPFTARGGRAWERWTFAVWVRLGRARHAVTASGVTGTSGRRSQRWHAALSEHRWCRVEVDDDSVLDFLRGDRDSARVRDLRPISSLSDAGVTRYRARADLDLRDTARVVFAGMVAEPATDDDARDPTPKLGPTESEGVLETIA